MIVEAGRVVRVHRSLSWSYSDRPGLPEALDIEFFPHGSLVLEHRWFDRSLEGLLLVCVLRTLRLTFSGCLRRRNHEICHSLIKTRQHCP